MSCIGTHDRRAPPRCTWLSCRRPRLAPFYTVRGENYTTYFKKRME